MAISLGAPQRMRPTTGGERTGDHALGQLQRWRPGVDWKSSVFTVEDTTGHNLGAREARRTVNEGTGLRDGHHARLLIEAR